MERGPNGAAPDARVVPSVVRLVEAVARMRVQTSMRRSDGVLLTILSCVACSESASRHESPRPASPAPATAGSRAGAPAARPARATGRPERARRNPRARETERKSTRGRRTPSSSGCGVRSPARIDVALSCSRSTGRGRARSSPKHSHSPSSRAARHSMPALTISCSPPWARTAWLSTRARGAWRRCAFSSAHDLRRRLRRASSAFRRSARITARTRASRSTTSSLREIRALPPEREVRAGGSRLARAEGPGPFALGAFPPGDHEVTLTRIRIGGALPGSCAFTYNPELERSP